MLSSMLLMGGICGCHSHPIRLELPEHLDSLAIVGFFRYDASGMRSNGKLLAADKVRKTPEGIKMRRRGTIFNPTSLQYSKQKQALHPPKVWMISAYSKTSSPPRHHCCSSWFNGSWDRLRFNPVTTV